MNLQGYNLIIEENIDSCNWLLNAEIYNSESPSCNGAILINEISGGSGNYSWDLVNYAWESYEYYNLCEGYYEIEVFDNEYNCSKIFSFYIGITDISFSLDTSELNYVYAGNSNTNWLGFTGNIPEEFISFNSFFDFIIFGFVEFFRSFLEPLPSLNLNIYNNIQFAENIVIAIVIICVTYVSLKSNYRIAIAWIFFLIFSLLMTSVIVDNLGTLSRYKFPIILTYVIFISYNHKYVQKKKN